MNRPTLPNFAAVLLLALSLCGCSSRPAAVLDRTGWKPSAAAFSADGSVVAGVANGRAAVWDAETGRRLAGLRHGGVSDDARYARALDSPRHVGVSPDGRLVALPTVNGVIVWAWANKTIRDVPLGLRAAPAALQIDDAGRVVAVAIHLAPRGGDRGDRVELAFLDGDGVRHRDLQVGRDLVGLAVAPDLRSVAVASRDYQDREQWAKRTGTGPHIQRDYEPATVRVHDVPPGNIRWERVVVNGLPSAILAFSFPGGRFLLADGEIGRLRAHRMDDGATTAIFAWTSTGDLHALVKGDELTHRIGGGFTGSLGLPLLVDGRPGVYFEARPAGKKPREWTRRTTYSPSPLALSPDGRRMLDDDGGIWNAPW